jgi:hypothetical protein
MAIVQISRITARKGLQVDLPQPLAAAELGWAIDDRRLFIGNGDLADGAPTVGNTEILTEYSNLLEILGTYTYKGDAAGYTVQTGTTGGNPVSQSLQSRLDSYAIVTDFGAVGDGVTDNTDAINRALEQLYCRDNNPAIRRSLFFPAGVYLVSDTILIPPFALLYGEGADSSVISFQALTWTNTIAYVEGVLVKDGATYYRSIAAVPIGIDISNTSYWDQLLPAEFPECIARTTDNLQQTAANIGSNGAIQPQWISIDNLGFETTEVHDGVLLDQCINISANNIKIIGPLTTADLTTASDDSHAIAYNSTATYVVSNASINQGYFGGFTYATNTQEQIQSIVYNQCDFDTLYLGIKLGGASPVNGGPTGIKINNCAFDNIYVQGVWIQSVSNNIMSHNVFYDVGNHFNGVGSPASSVMYFDAWNNVSVGDMFQRNDTDAATYPRIELNNSNTIALGMNTRAIEFFQQNVAITTAGNNFDLGTLKTSAGIQDTLLDNDTGTIAALDKSYITSFKMDYTIIRDVAIRTGSILVAGGEPPGSTGFTYSDDYVENGTTGVTLTVSDTGTEMAISYVTSSTGDDAIIKYTISNFGV